MFGPGGNPAKGTFSPGLYKKTYMNRKSGRPFLSVFANLIYCSLILRSWAFVWITHFPRVVMPSRYLFYALYGLSII